MLQEDLRRKIDLFEMRIRGRNFIGYAACLIVVAGFGYFYFIFPNPIQRVGAVLTILGAGYFVYQFRWNWRLSRESAITAAKTGSAASIEFFRTELQRQRDFHRGIWLWSRLVIFVPGPLVFIAGFEIAHPEIATAIRADAAAFLLLAALGIPLNLRLASRYQKQIDALEGVQEEGQ